jgi:hypothetical protein
MSNEQGPARVTRVAHSTVPLLRHVVYCSIATEGLGDIEVSRIVALAQRRNLVTNITGVLAFANGVFLQWIEGPRVQVERLMSSLHRDKRHHDIVTLIHTDEVRQRRYPNWDMQPVDAGDIRKILDDALSGSADVTTVGALKRVVALLEAKPLQSTGQS